MDVSSLFWTPVTKCQRSDLEELVSVPGHDVIRLVGLGRALMDICRADWRAADGN